MTAAEFHLFGDRASFAIEARLVPDPDPTGAASEDVWSYGEVRLHVRNRCLTRHSAPDGVRDEIRWYLAPLLRWLGRAWLPLFHEQRAPFLAGSHDNFILRFEQGERLLLDDEGKGATERRAEMQDWRGRHALWSAAAGGVLPNVWIRRQSDLCEVSFDPGVTVGAPRSFEFRFGRGAVLLDAEVVARAFHGFLRWGRAAGSHAGADIPLPGEHEDMAFQAERWLIGDHLSAILTRAEVPPSPMQDGVIASSSPEVALLGTVRPDLETEDADRLLLGLRSARSGSPEPPRLRALTARMGPPTAETAWEQGYDLALRTLEALDGPGEATGFVDVARLLPELGIDVGALRIGDVSLRGAAIAGDGFRPTILVNEGANWNRGAAGRRFTLAHEFGHILADRGPGRRVAHSSTPWAPEIVERRANAFAAMFLMPYRAVDAATAAVGRVADGAGLARMARRLGCGRTAVLEHLKNLDRIDANVYFRIKAEMADAGP